MTTAVPGPSKQQPQIPAYFGDAAAARGGMGGFFSTGGYGAGFDPNDYRRKFQLMRRQPQSGIAQQAATGPGPGRSTVGAAAFQRFGEARNPNDMGLDYLQQEQFNTPEGYIQGRKSLFGVPLQRLTAMSNAAGQARGLGGIVRGAMGSGVGLGQEPDPLRRILGGLF